MILVQESSGTHLLAEVGVLFQFIRYYVFGMMADHPCFLVPVMAEFFDNDIVH